MATKVLTLPVRNLAGELATSWTGDPASTVAAVKKEVAEQVGKHVVQVSLLREARELMNEELLADLGLPEGAELQLVIDNAAAERKIEKLRKELKELNYNSGTREVYPLAVECLGIGVPGVDEVAGLVRDSCEEAGSCTEMPEDWFEQLAAHPDSKCDTPAQFHNDLIHAAIFHGISLEDKPFFRNGPWTDKVDYPEWGWGSRIAGTPLDMAARKLEVALESPPHWGLDSRLPRPDGELDRLQANFMVLLRNGFKMSRVEGGGRELTELHDTETAWKPQLLERSEAPYSRYAAIHAAWREAGSPVVTIPAQRPPGEEGHDP